MDYFLTALNAVFYIEPSEEGGYNELRLSFLVVVFGDAGYKFIESIWGLSTDKSLEGLSLILFILVIIFTPSFYIDNQGIIKSTTNNKSQVSCH